MFVRDCNGVHCTVLFLVRPRDVHFPNNSLARTIGFARFASAPFSLHPSDMTTNYVHLTNSSINKGNHSMPHDMPRDPSIEGGSKTSLAYLAFSYCRARAA